MPLSRRQFHRTTCAAAVTGIAAWPWHQSASAEQASTGPLETFVPTRSITRGPANHWFGYYDKREFDPSGRYVLAMRHHLRDVHPREKILSRWVMSIRRMKTSGVH